jgi:hypothetical protein
MPGLTSRVSISMLVCSPFATATFRTPIIQIAVLSPSWSIARECDIPRLVFLVPENAKWEVQFLDSHTGEGKRGERVKLVREAVSKERVVGEFATPTSSAQPWLAAPRIGFCGGKEPGRPTRM